MSKWPLDLKAGFADLAIRDLLCHMADFVFTFQILQMSDWTGCIFMALQQELYQTKNKML